MSAAGSSGGFRLSVRLAEAFRDDGGAAVLAWTEPVATLGELRSLLEARLPSLRGADASVAWAVNGAMVLHGVAETPLSDGDDVELLLAFAGG